MASRDDSDYTRRFARLGALSGGFAGLTTAPLVNDAVTENADALSEAASRAATRARDSFPVRAARRAAYWTGMAGDPTRGPGPVRIPKMSSNQRLALASGLVAGLTGAGASLGGLGGAGVGFLTGPEKRAFLMRRTRLKSYPRDE